MTFPQASLHAETARAAAKSTRRAAISATLHLTTAAALLFAAVVIAHATLSTLLAIPTLAATAASAW